MIKARLKRALDYIEKRREASKEKTKRLNKETSEIQQNEDLLKERCWKGYTQKGFKKIFGKTYPNCVKKTKK